MLSVNLMALATTAGIARYPSASAAVIHVKLAPATSAAYQSRQQRWPLLDGAAMRCAALGAILFKHSLVPQILFPADVTRVSVEDQDLPLRLRFAPSIALARPPVADHRLRSGSTIGKRPGITGVLQDLT